MENISSFQRVVHQRAPLFYQAAILAAFFRKQCRAGILLKSDSAMTLPGEGPYNQDETHWRNPLPSTICVFDHTLGVDFPDDALRPGLVDDGLGDGAGLFVFVAVFVLFLYLKHSIFLWEAALQYEHACLYGHGSLMHVSPLLKA